MTGSDPIRPLLGAGVAALLYWVSLNLLIPPLAFVGGQMVAVTVTTFLAAVIASALGMAMFESRPIFDLGLAWRTGSARNLALGLCLGIGGAGLVVLPVVLTSHAHFEWVSHADTSWRAAIFTPLLLLFGAAGEEIAFRGFALQFLMRGYGNWAGIFGVGALFGLLHAANPGATTLGIINTAGFGVLFGAAVLRTHDLWLPIGIHFGWNATLPFLGVELSGLTIRVTGYRLVWTTGDLWSGGSYGPEASVLASAVLVLLVLAVWRARVSRGWAWLLDSEEAESQ